MRTILQYIADNAKLVEITSPTLRAERLLESDLNITNRVLIPSSPHCNIGETKDKQIFNHFFTEVMVNPESFILGPVLFDGSQQLASRIKILSERFFDDDAIDPSCYNITVLLEVFGDRDEYARRKGKVEDTIAFFGLVTRFEFLEMLIKFIERSSVFVVTRDICGEVLEFLQGGGRMRIIIWVLDVRCLSFQKLLSIHLSSCITNDLQILWEKALSVEAKKGREGLDIDVQ
jgi:hypothetical protein